MVQDLDELRQEIDDDEYDEIKSDTKEQLQVCACHGVVCRLPLS